MADLYGVSSDTWGDGNTESDAVKLMKDLVGYTNVWSTKFKDLTGSQIMAQIETKSQEGKAVLLSIDAHILGMGIPEGSWHSVAYIEGSYSSSTDSRGVEHHSFQVQTWGGIQTITSTSTEIKDYIGGAVYGYDK